MARGAETELTCRELVELVTDYLEDRLPAHERARFEAHLGECAACAAYVLWRGAGRWSVDARRTPSRPAQ